MIDRDQIEKMVVHPMKKEVRKSPQNNHSREEIKMEIRKVNKEEEMITEEIILQKRIMKIIKKREEYTYDFEGIIISEGVLELMQDGYGFLRSADYHYLVLS